jgi:uncharacterized protein YggE
MDRTITVRGTGRVVARPDQVEITLTLTAEQKEYDAAMDMAAEQLEGLQDALGAEGFEKDALKTTNFNVSTRYDFHHDERGNTTRVFLGYACTQNLRLTLSFGAARLGETLSAIASCTADPELNVRFTVADPSAVSDALLRSAAESARQKAEVLSAASGVRLGDLVKIWYSWGDRDFTSPTALAVGNGLLRAKASMDFTPENIDLTDQATFTWEIL